MLESLIVLWEPLGVVTRTGPRYHRQSLLYIDARGDRFIASCHPGGEWPADARARVSAVASAAIGAQTPLGGLACVTGAVDDPAVAAVLPLDVLLAPGKPLALLVSGPDLGAAWARIAFTAQRIAAAVLSYSPLTFNGNSVLGAALRAAGITPPLATRFHDPLWSPAAGNVHLETATPHPPDHRVSVGHDASGHPVVTVIDSAGERIADAIALNPHEGKVALRAYAPAREGAAARQREPGQDAAANASSPEGPALALSPLASPCLVTG